MYHFFSRILFIVGILIGVYLAILLSPKNPSSTVSRSVPRPLSFVQYEKWSQSMQIHRRPMLFDTLRYTNTSYLAESTYLYNKIDVFCLILVRNQRNAEAAKATWAQSCNSVQLVNITFERKMMPIKRKIGETSWAVMCTALIRVPDQHNWIIIAYDYTFFLVENLRMFVASLDPDNHYYLGHAAQFWGIIYNMGEAGYVLSHGALKALKERLGGSHACTADSTYRYKEDLNIGKYMAGLNITPSDTRDSEGLSTFHPSNLYRMFNPKESEFKASFYPHQCCSKYTIAFQSIEGSKMYTFYYLLYQLQIFKYGNLGNKPLLKMFPDDKVWKEFLTSRNISTNISDEQYYQTWTDLVQDPTVFARQWKQKERSDYDESYN